MSEVTGTEAPAATTEGQAAPKKRAPKTNLLDIVRGRLPIPFVFAIRFVEAAETSNAIVAKKYGTSVGKVFDIRKNRNFSYVGKDYKFNADELNAARAWGNSAGEHGGDSKALVEWVDAQTIGDAETLKAQEAAKPKKEIKRKPKADKAAAGAATPAAGDAASLLS
jgi:hypothetical protein